MKNWIEQYLEYTSGTEACDDYKKAAAYSIIATAVGNKCYVDWDGKVIPNLYTILTSPPGFGRKGTIISTARSILSKNLSFKYSTIDQAINHLEKNSNSLCVFEDISTLLENKDDLIYFIDWFSSGSWVINRISKSVTIKDMSLSILGALATNDLKSIINSGESAHYFLSRALLVPCDKVQKRIAFPKLKKDNLQNLEKISKVTGEFKLSQQATILLSEWYGEHTKEFIPVISDAYHVRRQTYVLKLSLIQAISRMSDHEISYSDVKTAIDFIEKMNEKLKNTLTHD